MGEISVDLSENIPGDHSDRKTPRGELHWIFTAVTDTIAWNTLPSNVFQKLFREDLLAASLFRLLHFFLIFFRFIFIVPNSVCLSACLFVCLSLFLCVCMSVCQLMFNFHLH